MQSTGTSWEAPGCPYHVEFAADKLEKIRLAVVESFYAMPRGGIEIGGLLFGTRDGERLLIEDYRIIECEHKTGPSFQLSEKDQARLSALIAASPSESLGWFHSHTRSEIFLSADDLAIHDKFFPKPWQVALVLRPANLQPVRAGYFFRDASGHMAAEKSCREFVLETTVREAASRQAPAPVRDAPKKPVVAAPEAPAAKPRVIQPEPEIAPALENNRGAAWVWIAAVVAALALGLGAYVTRAAWLPAQASPPALKLQASEVDGKLFVRWNPVQNESGKLTIDDGPKHIVIDLDTLQMSRGFYVYGRQSEKTTLQMKAGASEDLTTFAGPSPPHIPTPEEIENVKRDHQKAKDDLRNQTLRNRQLQRKVRELSNQLQEQKP
ncbi:MAG: Mov34/MPN/PAD family protein [Bryobacterales bacterium]|nr:Mov34/MPN/PAD family protein [Bryobacterales bacterium]